MPVRGVHVGWGGFEMAMEDRDWGDDVEYMKRQG